MTTQGKRLEAEGGERHGEDTGHSPRRGQETRPQHQGEDRVTAGKRYARALNPRQTLLVHLSGHPDGRGNPGWGWTNARWQTEAQTVWAQQELPGSVRVPAIGDVLEIG